MSYVLNALRRADAERERGAVPDLHAQATPELGDDGGRGETRGPWLWLLGLIAAGLLVALVWLLATREAPAPMAAPSPATPAAAAAPVAVPASAPAVAQPQVLIRIEAPAAPATPAPAAARPAAPPATDEPIAKWSELPEAWRRQVPAMVFGGAMDSPVASSRMLIVNGQVVREGESPSPGLVLERIQLRSAVFSFQGRRFEVSY